MSRSASDPETDPARFRWAAGARLIDPAGRCFSAGDPVAGGLAPVFAAAARGEEFCLTRRGVEVMGRAAPGKPPCFQCETSGTSGTPKRIRRTQASWLASIRLNGALFGIGSGRAVAVLGGLESSLAFYGAVEALCLGADLHLLAGLRPDRQIARLTAGSVRILYATPTQVRQLAAVGRPCPGLAHLLVGGGRFDPATRAAAVRIFPAARITEFYGAAETSFIALSDRATPDGSVGRAYPGVEIAIRDESGAPLPSGETGEIWVKSPYLFEGYARGHAPQTRREGAWLTIGEMGARDADGYLRIAGRRTRMVTIADCNVSLDAVEALLLGFEGVRQAGVIALPDRLRGHVLAGFVQCADGTCVEAILRSGRAVLGPLAAPRQLHRLSDWPLLPSGKTDYAALQAQLAGTEG